MDRLEVLASLVLARDPQAPRTARRFIGEFCSTARLSEEISEVASVLTSELVTNAVRYGSGQAVLEARLPAGVLRVSVADGSPDLPVVGPAAEITAETGRGVLLVSTLSSRWGIDELPTGGKAVWFELDPAGGTQ